MKNTPGTVEDRYRAFRESLPPRPAAWAEPVIPRTIGSQKLASPRTAWNKGLSAWDSQASKKIEGHHKGKMRGL